VCEHVFVSGELSVMHADADAFYASVEQRDDTRLRGRPVIVGGGVVLAASYEAKARGVRGGMGGARARRLCPDAIEVEPRWPAYVEASKELFRVFDGMSPTVEAMGMEEAFLDLRGLARICGSPAEIGARLRQRARERVGLPVTVGIATTKFLAKMASRAAKPDGLLVVAPEDELDFLHPLAVESLWGVGEATARRLHASGIRTVAELAAMPERYLVSILGRARGRHLYAIAQNDDRRRVRSGTRRRSVGSQSALGPRPRSAEEIETVLVSLVDRVTRRMRAKGRVGRTVTLRLRFGDYSRATRSLTLGQATSTMRTVLVAAKALLDGARPLIGERGLTLIGVAVTDVSMPRAGVQLPLALGGRDDTALDAAVDRARDRFGAKAVTRASLVRRGARYESWIRPGE
jgi:DNA polymerase-4